jgi:hypothetical protein
MDSDILNEQGRAIRKKNTRIVRLFKCAKRNWSVWVPVLISLVALAMSGWSAWQSAKNNQVARRLSKLDFRPTLRLYSLFKPVGKIPPHWELTNTGPIEAIQIKVEMISHRYFPQKKGFMASLRNSINTTTISSIKPQETKSYEFQEGWLNSNARLQDPVQFNVMEILVTYRRPQDLKDYSDSAYYFINPNGLWVCEGSNSLKGEPYESMMTALFKLNRGPFSIYREWEGDRLHSNR